MEFKILEKMFAGEEPKSVFEIGCANGGLLKDLVEHYGGVEVGGMDCSQSLLLSKELFPENADNFILRDLNDPWPVPDKRYDIVFSVGVLMYIFDPVPVLKEMFRVAKNKVILAEYHHPAVNIFGQLTAPYFADENKIQMGIIRNYVDLLRHLNIPMEILVTDSGEGKTILKCIPTKSNT